MTLHKRRVAVLRGGINNTHSFSMQYGAELTAQLSSLSGVEVIDVMVTKSGEWLLQGFQRTPEAVLSHIDIAIIAMFGTYAEDGEVQRTLTRYHVPFIGARAFQSSVSLHKKMAKDQVRSLNIPVLKHFTLNKETVNDVSTTATTAAEMFGPDFIVKPLKGALGEDVRACTGISQLATTLEELFKTHDEVMVEEFKTGRVVTCGVAEGLREQSHYTTPVAEVLGGELDSFVVPARISREARAKVADYTKRIHSQLDLRHFSESDFVVDPSDNVFYLETNSLPSLKKEASYVAGLEAFGVSEEEFLTHLLQQAAV